MERENILARLGNKIVEFESQMVQQLEKHPLRNAIGFGGISLASGVYGFVTGNPMIICVSMATGGGSLAAASWANSPSRTA